MNFRKKITLSFLFYVVLCSVASAQVVEIPDPNLRAAVREALNIADHPDVELTQSLMQRLTNLRAPFSQISDLEGLQYATNITELALDNNSITDLHPIAALAGLTFLRLHDNNIIDVGPLANLTQLNTLLLANNNIVDVAPLATLVNLSRLELQNNHRILDVSPLANLGELTKLLLGGNNITDVTPLANLTSLKHLELQDNRITDITPLENLTNLDYLDTQNNPIFDPHSPIVEMPDPNLRAAVREALNIADRPEVELTRALIRRHLTGLRAPFKQISDLEGLQYATNITELALDNNSITDLRPIAALTRLIFLRLHDNNIVDVSPLANLTQLNTLLLANNNIVDVAPLATLVNLSRLELQNNHSIFDVSPLANLGELTKLLLGGNNITDVTPLANLTNLEQLELQGNRIIDHSPVHNLSLTTFLYDETCDMPRLPLSPRLENRTFPSVFAAWGGLYGSPVLNHPHLSAMESIAQHDLHFASPMFDHDFFDTGKTWELRGAPGRGEQIRDEFRALNPNMVFIVEIRIKNAYPGIVPEDSPYWKKDADGELVADWPGSYEIDVTHPVAQEIIINQALAVARCGLYDGVFFDHWGDSEHPGALGRARRNIIERIRAETRPDFLIMGNTNDNKIPRTGEHINGGFMETLVPHDLIGDNLEEGLARIEDALLWLESNLKAPRVNALEGWAVPGEPLDGAINLRWMRAFTTFSLTHSDGYVLFNDGVGHSHLWYDFWDADLGRPLSEEKATVIRQSSRSLHPGIHERLGGIQPQRGGAGDHIAGGGAGCGERFGQHRAYAAES